MFQVPFRQNNNFVGRHDILAEMARTIRENQSADGCVPLVLSGLGGMGKTQLMLKYCHTHRKEYTCVFWLDASEKSALLYGFQKLAEKLGIKIDEDKAGEETLVDCVHKWLQSRTERWLLLFDNVYDMDDMSDFIPRFGGDVIVTTRDYVDKRQGSVIKVDKMSKEDALLLLIGPKKIGIPPTYAMKIVEELDCMPLAVDIARAYIDRTGTPFEKYLEMYSRKHTVLFKNTQDMHRNQYKHTVATVWNLSFEKLHERSTVAGLILGACAFLHPDAIPVSLFERQSAALMLHANINAIREAIGILVEFSFVRRTITHDLDSDGGGDDNDYDPAKNVIAIHRLVQEVIRESTMKGIGQKAWGECLVAAIDKEVVSDDFYNPQVRKINDRVYPSHPPHRQSG